MFFSVFPYPHLSFSSFSVSQKRYSAILTGIHRHNINALSVVIFSIHLFSDTVCCSFANHSKEIGTGKTISKFFDQLYRQRRDNFLTVVSPLFLQNILADTVADLPVKNRQSGVNRDGDIMPGNFNERPDITDKIAGNGLVVCFYNLFSRFLFHILTALLISPL